MDEDNKKEAKMFYLQEWRERKQQNDQCTQEEIEQEAKWMEEVITNVLDRFAPPARVCKVSKPLWNKDIKVARTRAGRVQWEEKNL